MKKVIVLFITFLLLTGCGNEKNGNDSQFKDYTLKVKGSEICEFNNLSVDINTTIKSYCIDSILITDRDNKTYELKSLLQEGLVDIDDVLNGLIIKSEEKDGSVVLYQEEHPEYNIIKCADKYPNDYIIVNFMDYQKFFCEL